MKILDIVQSSEKVVIAQNYPGSGFQSQIKFDCNEKNIDIINFSSPTISSKKVENLSELKKATVFIVDGFNDLNHEDQVSLFKELNNKLKENKDLKIILSCADIKSISPEIIKDSCLIIGPKFKFNYESNPNIVLSSVIAARDRFTGGISIKSKKLKN